MSQSHRSPDRTTLITCALVCAIFLTVGVILPQLQPNAVQRILNPPKPLGTPPKVLGSGEYEFLSHQKGHAAEPVAYDPCQPIQVEVNPLGGPDRPVAMVRDAMAQIALATGLKLVYVGTTDRRPHFREGIVPTTSKTDEPVLVSWATASELHSLKGTVAGMGGSTAVQDSTGFRYYVTGQIALDVDAFDQLSGAPDGRIRQRAIVMHEFAHVIGLDHVDDKSQLMHPRPTATTFATGDRLGLAKLGAGKCR